jgi:hypothetical protein
MLGGVIFVSQNLKKYILGVTSGTGTIYSSGAPEFTSSF